MSLSDSMFLFEIIVEELRSHIECKKFYIRSQFADIFTLNLKDPNELASVLPKQKKLKKKRATVRNVQSPYKKQQNVTLKRKPEKKIQTGQSILFAGNIEKLRYSMQMFPIELSLWDKDDTENRLGSTHIRWSPVYFEYLDKLTTKTNPSPASNTGEYSVFDETSSKRMATMRMNIKLTYLKDKITSTFRSLSEDNQKTFVYTGFNSKATTILSTVKDDPVDLMGETGIIKTIYGGKRKLKSTGKTKKKATNKTNETDASVDFKEHDPLQDAGEPFKCQEPLKDRGLFKGHGPSEDHEIHDEHEDFNKTPDKKCKINRSIVNFVKSDTDLDRTKYIKALQNKSSTSLSLERYNPLNYVFGDRKGPYGNQVYCVGYFTVENDFAKSTPSKTSQSSKGSVKESSERSEDSPKERYKFRVCHPECLGQKPGDDCSHSVCSVDLPAEAADLITVTKCGQVDCEGKKHNVLPEPPDDRILLDLTNLTPQPCSQTVEEVSGGVTAQLKLKEPDCYCTCECTFGFIKKTTYCGICGGYEKPGEDFSQKLAAAPFPCPIYHKLTDKKKQTYSNSGSDSKKKLDDSQRSLKGGVKSIGSAKSEKNAESEKDLKKGKKKKKDDRFKFNYGYTAPQIGHADCAMPCTGTLGAVPKNMGWLWTAEDVPGMKFRPSYKPGATNKHVVRLLRMAKNPGEIIAKKKRKEGKKKSLKRPLLMVHKKDGEYTITMETMKAFQKPRVINQYPYEDKPVLTYTIGRTDEENRERRKKKERAQRRLERDQRNFIQSAFQDMCKDICLKTYQQALGILPDAEDPECPCYPKLPNADQTNLDLSCSCSEDKVSINSDTDDDEWIVEFTPPNATFDPTFKSKKVVKVDNTSQYTYLDYRVKLSDRYGNPVPRFFKGPDGKNQCSDLGGFWNPEHKWLEINVDGYIAPDGRWAPFNFLGPSGEQIECDTGKFQTANAKWLVVGIDGYVENGKWRFYQKPRGSGGSQPKKQQQPAGAASKKGTGDKKDDKAAYKPSEASWSCFGDVTPKHLSKLGIVGHGHDRKILLATLQEMLAHGEDIRIPSQSVVPRMPPPKKGFVRRPPMSPRAIEELFAERNKCRHPQPTDKGIIAVDAHGHKAYFKMRDPRNKRPKQRIADLTSQGISVSSFHMPCFHSFINAEMLRQQQLDRMISDKSKCVSTQAS